jgi:dynein heavy chain 1
MVWFSEEVIRPKMIFSHYLQRLRQEDYDKVPKINLEDEAGDDDKQEKRVDKISLVRQKCVEIIEKLFVGEGSTLGEKGIEIAEKIPHVMEFTVIRVIEA